MTPRSGILGYGTGTAATGAGRREVRRTALADVSLPMRVWARLFAGRYDQQIEQGVRQCFAIAILDVIKECGEAGQDTSECKGSQQKFAPENDVFPGRGPTQISVLFYHANPQS